MRDDVADSGWRYSASPKVSLAMQGKYRLLSRPMNDPLQRAIKAVGGVCAMARAVGIKSQAVSQWKRVPAERVITVEKVAGVPRHELRPDLYPPPDAATQATGAAA